MILLFNSKASKTSTANKSSNVKNHPVENSGILAMNPSDAKSLLTMGEYDSYVSSSPVAVNYAMYSDFNDSSSDFGFMSSFSSAVAVLGDCGFSSGSSDFGGASYSGGASFSSCSSSSGSFASVC